MKGLKNLEEALDIRDEGEEKPLISECCGCETYRLKSGSFYEPTRDERRMLIHNYRRSHTYCSECDKLYFGDFRE